jgi:tellurite resistance protein TehA-like permease
MFSGLSPEASKIFNYFFIFYFILFIYLLFSRFYSVRHKALFSTDFSSRSYFFGITASKIMYSNKVLI